MKTSGIGEEFLSVSKKVHDNAYDTYKKGFISIPSIPNLDHWFRIDVQKAISSIMSAISSVDTTRENKDGLFFSLSAIIVRVSNQESDTRYAAIEKRVTGEDVFSSFITSCKKLAIAKQEQIILASADVIEKDILKCGNDEINKPVGLVITSPPYPNAYEYWLYHKYRMWWLGYDPIAVRSYEIGARPHFQRKNGQTEKDFERQMDKVFDLFDSSVISGGHICIVIGRSIIRGREIDNAELISQIAKTHNYVQKASIPREIASSRKSRTTTSSGGLNIIQSVFPGRLYIELHKRAVRNSAHCFFGLFGFHNHIRCNE